MCEANAYILKNGTEELLLEDVDKVIPGEDGILLENIFGQQKIIKARIKEMALVNHKIILEKIE
ncbi:MAG: RNA-binding protein [Firmicutes bacterium HGW-Firmicutes-14]|nr:MAG: RNA-binding protein [Firmicutes bacterium HGW-Firmicutes-14]